MPENEVHIRSEGKSIRDSIRTSPSDYANKVKSMESASCSKKCIICSIMNLGERAF